MDSRSRVIESLYSVKKHEEMAQGNEKSMTDG